VLLFFIGALAHVVGVINPAEKVNGLWLVVAAACIYVLACRFGRERLGQLPYSR
jgi:carbon starvation protein